MGATQAPADTLTAIDIVRYGFPAAALALLGIPLFLLVPAFFVDDLGLPAASVGLALLAARLLDLFIDPALGHWCRTAPRARLVLVLGVPLLLAGVTLLFRPSDDAGAGWLFAGALLAYLGWSLVAVPLLAIGAVLPGDDAGRSRLAFGREAFTLVGTLLAIVVPAALSAQDGTRASLAVAWWILLVLVPLTLPALWPLATRAAWGGVQPWATGVARSAALFGFAPFRRTLLAYFLNALANAIPATLLVLYVTHVLRAEADLGLFLALYLGAGLLAMPAWLWVARRQGAGQAWLASMLWAAGVFALVPFMGSGDVLAFALVCIATGFSVGADNALPAALQARVVADLRARAGDDDAALAFGWWSVTTKLALAAGAAIGLVAIDAGGFRPGEGSAEGTTALVLAYAVLPVLFKLLAVAAAWPAMRRSDALAVEETP